MSTYPLLLRCRKLHHREKNHSLYANIRYNENIQRPFFFYFSVILDICRIDNIRYLHILAASDTTIVQNINIIINLPRLSG